MPTIEERIRTFKADLENDAITNEEIVNKYISFGTPYIFQDDEGQYHRLKQHIATKYSINNTEIIMIGSAKLGFSIAPIKIWKFFSDDSDIDVAIISESLFNLFWKELFDFNISLVIRTEQEESKYRSFLEYFFKGWLRPDLFPFEFEQKWGWFDFFRGISHEDFEGRKIAAAIFKEHFFFQRYHSRNIQEIRGGS